jgi:deoxyadenosine/deoxycytidine kinase
MNRKIIIITGYLAAGKSAFACKLSEIVNVPLFMKDTFKNAICKSIIIDNRAESSRFSAVTFDALMYVAERLITAEIPIIIEGNFVPQGIKNVDEAGEIRSLIEKLNCRSLTYKFTGNTEVLHKRFIKRDKLPERGQANTMFFEPTLDEFGEWCHNLDAFDVGGSLVEVDATDFRAVDYVRLMQIAKDFLD